MMGFICIQPDKVEEAAARDDAGSSFVMVVPHR